MDLNEALWELQWHPGSGGRVRRLALTRRGLRRLCVAVVVVLLGVLAINAVMPLGLRAYLGRFTPDAVRRENEVLTRQLEAVREQAAALAVRTGVVYSRAQRAAWLAGTSAAVWQRDLDDPPVAVAGDDALLNWLVVAAEAVDRIGRDLSVVTLASRCPPGALPLAVPVPLHQAVPVALFGWRVSPFTGKRVPLRGVELACPTGTPVVAPGGGRVVFVGASGGRAAADWAQLGTVVVIDHSGGVYSILGHLRDTAVKRGQLVIRGAKVGSAGQSGWTRVPAVYFEVRWPQGGESVPINPALVALDLPAKAVAAVLARPAGDLPAEFPPLDVLSGGGGKLQRRRPIS